MKNRVNKQIIKALSVGLAASMALQPVTVFAETPDQKSEADESKESKTDAFDTASNSVENAHDAFVGESAPAATPEVSSDAPAAEQVAPITSVADAQAPAAEVENPIKDAKTETENYEETVKQTIPNASEVIKGAIDSLDNAESKLVEGGEALNDADQAVKDAQTSNQETENNKKEYNAHMDKAEEILEYGSNPAEGEDHVHQVGQFTDATTGAEQATSDYSGIITDAGKVKADMDEVKAAADKYNAEADTTGSQFAAIKKEYDDAKVVLDGLDQRLSDATDKYNAADKNYDDAVDAYTSAKNEYDLALAAYNAIIDTVDKDGNVKDGSETTTSKKIELAKEKLAEAQKALDEAKLTQAEREKLKDSAENEVKDAKTNLEAAKSVVEQKLTGMQNSKYQEIIDLQTEIDRLPDGTAKDAKKVELQKKFIEYYLLKDEGVTEIQFSNDKAAFVMEPAKDINGNVIVDEDGDQQYITGYVNGVPQFAKIPSAYTVTYKKDGVADPITVYYSVDPSNTDGTFTVYTEDGTPIQQSTELEAKVDDKYVDADNNDVQQSVIDAVDENQKHTKENNNVLVIDKNDKIADIETSESLTTYSNETAGEYKYVEGSDTSVVSGPDENGVKTRYVTKTYTKIFNTESLTMDENQPAAEYQYGTHEVVTETVNKTYPFSQEGYVQWKADIEKYEDEEDFCAEFYDVDLIWWGPFIVDYKEGMKNIKDKTDSDNISILFDIVANYLFDAQPFTISYTKSETTTTTEDKEGFFETVKENYTHTEKEVEKTFTQTTKTTLTPVYEVVTNNGSATAVPNSQRNIMGEYEHASDSKWNLNDAVNARDQKISELNGQDGYTWKSSETSSVSTTGNVKTTTYTWTERKYVSTGWDWDRWGGSIYYYGTYRKVQITYTRTVTETTTGNVIDYTESEPVVVDPNYTYKSERTIKDNSDPKSITKSKTFYGADEYKFVEGHAAKNGYYYDLNDSEEWGSSADSTYKEAIRGQQTAHQNLLDAQEAYRRASVAYQYAQDALDKAKADVNALSASMASKGDLLGAEKRLSAAETALGIAAQNKEAAEIALGDALTKKGEAERAVQAAKDAFELTKPSYDKAEADKKAADDARNNQSGGGDDTTGGGDDTTTGGGDGTTTFIPVAVTPATNVAAPAADNAQAPAVLGARTTRKTTAKSAADTDTVATDNSNGNGDNDNSAVAGAQKEETKTPEASKEETKIDDGDVALQATPELEERSFAWWWLLILAALAGVSVEEYVRRKSNKAKAEAKDSTKINK